MKYHKFFYPTETEAQEFVASIEGDFQYVILPRFTTPESEDEQPQMLGYMVDVCGKEWQADMTHEVRPETHEHWFAGMEQHYFNSINHENTI